MSAIYCWVNGRFGPADLTVMAMAEDGTFLASHVSSNEMWAKSDIGMHGAGSRTLGAHKHDAYREHYPDGYDLEWVDAPQEHDGLKAAIERNQALAAASNHEQQDNQPQGES